MSFYMTIQIPQNWMRTVLEVPSNNCMFSPFGSVQESRVQESTVQSLYNTVFGVQSNELHIVSEVEQCFKGTIFQKKYRKMSIVWLFSYKSFVKLHGEKV